MVSQIDSKLEFNLEIEISSNKNNLFSIIFNEDAYSFLNIKAIQKNDIFNKSFSNKFSINEIKENNKYFILFNDLKEICNELSERLKTNEIKLIENKKNLILLINLPISTIKEIKFNLNEDEKNDEEKYENLKNIILKFDKINEENKIEINELKTIINNQKKEESNNKNLIKELKNNINDDKNLIKELKNTINSQKNELINEINKNKNLINELKNIINNQKIEINDLKEQMNTWIEYKKIINKKSELDNSLIINNNIDYIESLKKWINPPNNIIKAVLLYRLSRDGDKISKFHELCDNKGPTLSLFHVEDGNKGGIYTPLSWDSNFSNKNDRETFIFK